MLTTVLLVEDDARFSEVFAHAIRSAPSLHLVGIATDITDGRDALKAMEPDVLLLDLGLPSGNGIELIRFVEEHLPQCETVVVTVTGDHETVLRCIRAGATGYLLKEARDIDIVEQIRQLRSGGSPISPTIARSLLEDIGGRSARACRSSHKPLLSPQEIKVLRLSAKGYNYDEIGGLLGLSHHTIETYVKRVYRKLQVHSKTEAVYEARQLGFVPD